MSIQFVVVGSGRSGTRYASALFNQLGIACGHEAVDDWTRAPDTDLVGDSSLSAVPFLDGFAGAVFHQVRHPLAVLRSIVATGFFVSPGQFERQMELIERSLPDLHRRRGPVEKAMHYIVCWNRRCEPFADLRWRVEDLDAETLRQATRLAGRGKSLDECASALATVRKDVNRLELRGLKRLHFEWSDVPDGPGKEALLEMARRYGYPP